MTVYKNRKSVGGFVCLWEPCLYPFFPHALSRPLFQDGGAPRNNSGIILMLPRKNGVVSQWPYYFRPNICFAEWEFLRLLLLVLHLGQAAWGCTVLAVVLDKRGWEIVCSPRVYILRQISMLTKSRPLFCYFIVSIWFMFLSSLN